MRATTSSRVRVRRWAVWLAAGAAVACNGARVRSAAPAGAPAPTSLLELTEGTALYFDPTPDGAGIVIDLLGQLWEMPADGGEARALTDAAGEGADDRQPALSPDGAWIATRSDRAGGRGIWIHARAGSTHRPLSDSAVVLGDDVGLPVWLRDGSGLVYVRRGVITEVNATTGATRALVIDSLPNVSLDEPSVSADGGRLLVSGPWPGGTARALLDGASGTALWEIDLATGRVRRVTPEGVAARAPAYSPDGERIAYFVSDSSGVRLVVRESDGATRTVAAHQEIEPRRVRWDAAGRELLYVAAGRLRRVPAAGGASRVVPFRARLTLPRAGAAPARGSVVEPGSRVPVRGFTGLALAPDGARSAMLALGQLWLIGRDGSAHPAGAVPITALGVSWSPDARSVVWGDGVEGEQDLWVSDVATGASTRVTNLPGIEWPVGWSPGGAWIAFTHQDSIRAVRAPGSAAGDTLINLGPLRFSETAAFGSPWAWLRGDTLLVYGMNEWPVASRACVEAELVSISGARTRVEEFPCRPGHPAIAADGALLAIESGALVRHARTARGWGPAEPLTQGAALYPSAAADGSLLYVAPDGLHLRARTGADRPLGWPVSFDAPQPPPLLLRNVRIVPLDESDRAPRDVLITGGRIRALGAARSLALPAGEDGRIIDGQGRWLMPGLIDTHLHFIDTDIAVLRNALAHGVTTVREMWDALGVASAFRDGVDAGVETGARILVSGPPFYPSPTGVPVTTDFLWVTTNAVEIERGLDLLAGFGAAHVKMRYVQSWYGGADFVRRARAHGLRVSSHCAHAIAVVAAGITGHEHADGQCGEWEFGIRADIAQLYGGAGVIVTPIIDVHAETARRTPQLPDAARARLLRRTDRARAHARRFHAAGVPLATGSDAQGFPGGVQRELHQLVQAGLSPRAALLAATRDAAAALGVSADLGRVQPGYIADLILLDGDPLADIENTRRIRLVIQAGRVVRMAAPEDSR